MSTSSVFDGVPGVGRAGGALATIELDSVALRFRIFMDRSPVLKQFVLNKVLGRHKKIENYKDFWLYRNLSVKMDHGERVGIVGSNGAGKSTLLKVIAGIYHPTAGTIRVRGRIAPLIELGGGFNPELSGWENIFLNGALLGFSQKEMAAKANEILDFANLREFAEMPVKYYSSGMMLRLGFSIATDIVPEVLLLDEIFAAGDAVFRHKAQARMDQLLTASHIVVLVSHDLGLIKDVCNRVVWIDHGCVVMDGNPADVCSAYLDKRYPEGFRVQNSAAMWEAASEAGVGGPAVAVLPRLLLDDHPVAATAELKELVKKTDYRQPIYGVSGVGEPAGGCREKAQAVAISLAPIGKKFRLIEFGSSLGYFPFYFADRGATATGYDRRMENVAVAREAQTLNGLAANFQCTALDIDSAKTIEHGQYDVAFLFNVLHHMIHEKGVEYATQVVTEIGARIPVMVLELAERDEAGGGGKFEWSSSLPEDPLAVIAGCRDFRVKKIGGFGKSAMRGARPIYLVVRKDVTVIDAMIPATELVETGVAAGAM